VSDEQMPKQEPQCHCGLYECMGPDNVRPGFVCKKNKKSYHTIRVQQRALEMAVEHSAMHVSVEHYLQEAARELEGV
jgi:hypothetical protein